MKIVREKNTKKVLYLLDDWELCEITSGGMRGAYRAMDIRSDTHEIVEDVDKPEFFIGGGVLTYDNQWSVLDQATYAAKYADKLDKMRKMKLAKLEYDLYRYRTATRGYSVAKLADLASINHRIVRYIKNNPGKTALNNMAKRLIDLYDWCDDLNTYRYSKEDEINEASLNDIGSIDWDFSTFDDDDPKIKIREFSKKNLADAIK